MFGAPLLLLFLATPDQPAPKFPVGKETTYVTGPLDKEGYINYVAALNERLGQGVTPDKNANARLFMAIGPRRGDEPMPPEFFKALGIEEPPRRGDYFISLQSFTKDHLKLDYPERELINNQQSMAIQQPWTTKDFPHLVTWLKLNEKPLAVVIEATKLPDYFDPLVSSRTEKVPEGMIGALPSGMYTWRELANALTARAMFRVSEEKFDDAWQDLLACHRLGRLIARGATLIEALFGIAIDKIACTADLAYLERASLTTKQIQDRLKDLQSLPPMPPMADRVDLGERFVFLDCLQFIRRGGVGMRDFLEGGPAPLKPDPKVEKALEKIDWESALRIANAWYDRQAAALRLKDRASRTKELDKIENELMALQKNDVGLTNFLKVLLGTETVGKAIGNRLIHNLMPSFSKVQIAYDRLEQGQRNLHLAFALAAFRKTTGRYPMKLNELAPKYLTEIPSDLFSGRALVYRPSENGFLLYSVGPNGKDEEGRGNDDDPPGDDLRVRMPLPELKQKK